MPASGPITQLVECHSYSLSTMLCEVKVVGSSPTGTILASIVQREPLFAELNVLLVPSASIVQWACLLDSSHSTIGAFSINSSVVECDPSKVVTWVRFPFDAQPFSCNDTYMNRVSVTYR